MILRESYSLFTIISGVVIGIVCLIFYRIFFPLPKMAPIKPLRLVLYLFFLFGQVYIAGFTVIRIIFTTAYVKIVEIRTQISDKLLRTVLVNSITLVPGSISLDLDEDKITVLLIRRTAPTADDDPDELLKGKLEKMMLKAQK